MLNTSEDFSPEDAISNIIGQTIMQLVSASLISSRWIYNALTLVICNGTTIIYYNFVLGVLPRQTASSLIIIAILASYISYFAEKRNKSEFLQIKYNE